MGALTREQLDRFAEEPIVSIEQTRELFRNLVEERRISGIDIPAREFNKQE